MLIGAERPAALQHQRRDLGRCGMRGWALGLPVAGCHRCIDDQEGMAEKTEASIASSSKDTVRVDPVSAVPDGDQAIAKVQTRPRK